MTNYEYIKKVANMETINHISKKDLQGLLKEVVDWIESQDLIRREDVLSSCHFNKDPICRGECDKCFVIAVDKKRILQIPKAEPPKE